MEFVAAPGSRVLDAHKRKGAGRSGRPATRPDPDTIVAFRRRFLEAIEALVVEVLLLGRETCMLPANNDA